MELRPLTSPNDKYWIAAPERSRTNPIGAGVSPTADAAMAAG
jgi:hypothetical protein